jgi:hypothetical protein
MFLIDPGSESDQLPQRVVTLVQRHGQTGHRAEHDAAATDVETSKDPLIPYTASAALPGAR